MSPFSSSSFLPSCPLLPTFPTTAAATLRLMFLRYLLPLDGGVGDARVGVVAAAHVPGLDDPALGAVDVVLLLDVLDPDAHPVLGEDHVVPRHALLGVVPYLGYAEVDLVAHHGYDDRDHAHDHEGDELSPVVGGSRGGLRNGYIVQ